LLRKNYELFAQLKCGHPSAHRRGYHRGGADGDEYDQSPTSPIDNTRIQRLCDGEDDDLENTPPPSGSRNQMHDTPPPQRKKGGSSSNAGNGDGAEDWNNDTPRSPDRFDVDNSQHSAKKS